MGALQSVARASGHQGACRETSDAAACAGPIAPLGRTARPGEAPAAQHGGLGCHLEEGHGSF